MADTGVVYARINKNLKQEAEGILSQLGISPSSAVQMLYSQVVLNGGLPFLPSLPRTLPLDLGSLSRERLDVEIRRGVDSLDAGQGVSADAVDAMLAQEYGI